MNTSFERAAGVASNPGVRAGLLVEAVLRAIAQLGRRRNALTEDMRVTFTYVTEKRVHFMLTLDGEGQGLFSFSYDADGYHAPLLRKLPVQKDEGVRDRKISALENLIAIQLAQGQQIIWRSVSKSAGTRG